MRSLFIVRCSLAVLPLACGALVGCTDDARSGADMDGGSSAGGTSAAGGSGGSGGRTSGGAAAGGSATGATGGAASGGGGAVDDGGSPDSGPGDAGGGSSADSTWSDLSVLAVVDPMDHGAVGDGAVDDQAALTAAVNALPDAGGVVYLPEDRTFRKTDLLIVTKSHVKWWAPERQATLFQSVAGTRRKQSILCRNNDGCGFFGVKLTSDANARFDALEDNHISADHGSLVEVVGCEIDGAAASGIFLYGSTEHYIEGNYIHHTWADHVHHTDGASASWVWKNFIFNENPSRGDDGVACVTYGPASTRCRDMEWWGNTILGTGWGRGYSVIGGDDIAIHDNWAIGVAGAGIIVASEGSYDSASSSRITVRSNSVYQSGHTIGHPGILVSGQNAAAEPLDSLSFVDNVSVGTPGGAYRAEGDYTNVTNTGLLTTEDALPRPIPTGADVRLADTSILRTRDVSHVDAAFRPGLYRIHVRRAPGGTGFQQRFEYVIKGPPADVSAFVAGRTAEGAYIAEQRDVDGTAYALLLSSAPVSVPAALLPVPFRDLRAGDANGSLSWLWARLDSGSYD